MEFRLVKTALLMLPFLLPVALASDLYLPSVPSLPSELQTHPQKIQLTLSIFMYCFGLGQLIIGPLADRYGRRKVLVTSLLLFTIGSLICASSQQVNSLISGRALQALGACGSQVVALAMVRDQFSGKELTYLFSFLRGIGAISPIFSPFIGSFLFTTFGWKANFILLTFFGMAVLILGYYVLKETSPQSKPTSFLKQYINSYKQVLSHPGFLYFCACAIAGQTANFGHFSLSSRYYIVEHGLSQLNFVILFSINASCFLLTGLASGKILTRLGLRKSTILAAALFILSGFTMITASYQYKHPFVLFLPNLIASSSTALMLGASSSGAMRPFKETAGTASALMGCLEFMGGGLIGTLATRSEAISVIPLASSLILWGGLIVFMNVFFQHKLQTVTQG